MSSGKKARIASAKNRQLLETIRRTAPQSPAERTGRKKPNLSRTLKTMQQYGPSATSGQVPVQLRRRQRKPVPRVPYRRVAAVMELSA